MSVKVTHVEYELGVHVPFAGNIYNTLQKSIDLGMYSVQFFMGSPQSTNRSKISEDDLSKSKKLLDRFPLKVFTHFPYVSNLAGSVDCLAWEGNIQQDTKTLKVIESLQYELSVLSHFPNNGVVIHPGNFKDREIGLVTITKSINKLEFLPNSKLVLENSAGQGCSLATTFEELKKIIDNVDIDKRKHIGICIDTCHLFAYGDYDISKVTEVDRMLTDFDNIIGIKYLSLIHLNDSETPLRSKKDRHACIGKGHIWKSDNSSLLHLLKKCSDLKVPFILETEIEDMSYFST
jgi:apurinic endonuclease APN1